MIYVDHRGHEAVTDKCGEAERLVKLRMAERCRVQGHSWEVFSVTYPSKQPVPPAAMRFHDQMERRCRWCKQRQRI